MEILLTKGFGLTLKILVPAFTVSYSKAASRTDRGGSAYFGRGAGPDACLQSVESHLPE